MRGMAKYLVLIYGDEQRWAEQSAQWNEVNAAAHAGFAVEAGAALVGGGEVEPSATARSLRVGPDGSPAATEGPFVRTDVAIGGYYLLEAADMVEVTRLAGLLPEASAPDSGVEIRPVKSGG
jgi:hypothetical protein